jgi:predicted small metal-binding protein
MDMGRTLHCGDVVDGCDGVVTGADDQEVMRKAAAHAAEAHGMDEVDDATAAALQAAIRDD